MDRRLLLAALACWPAGRLAAAEDGQRPRHKISAGELYEALSPRFPLRLDVAGLLVLEVAAQRLLMLPARNQLGVGLLAEVSGLPGRRLPAGEIEVVFALRYERSDRTVRAREPQVRELRWPGLPPETQQALQGVLGAMARDLGELVLHRFTPRELALPDTMGFEPEELRVMDDGVMVFFGPKPRP